MHKFWGIVLLGLFIALWGMPQGIAQQPEYVEKAKEKAEQVKPPEAEKRGSIRGITRIAGPVREPLAHVRIEWVAPDGKRGTVSSDEMGRYVIPDLPPGEYVLNARREGFPPREGLRVTVVAGSETRYDIVFRREGEGVRAPREEGREPSADQLEREIERLKRQIREVGPDSDEAERLREKIQALQQRIKEMREKRVRREQRQPSPPDVREAEQELQRRKQELNRLMREKPDSPRVRELKERIAQLQKRIAQARSRMKPPAPRIARVRLELGAFPLEHVPAEHAARIVAAFAGDGATVVGDPWSNTLFVRAQPGFLQEVEKILHHMDVPPRPHEWPSPPEVEEREGRWHPEEERWHPEEERWHPEEERWHPEEEREHPEEEGPTLNLFLQPTEEGGVQLLFEERPLSLDQLEERLARLDDPHAWRLKLHVLGDVSREVLHDFVQNLEELAHAKGVRRLEIETEGREMKAYKAREPETRVEIEREGDEPKAEVEIEREE